MPLLLLSILSTFLLSASAADAPYWWIAHSVLDTNAVAKDYAAVNQGQAKWMAVQAAAELDRLLPGGAGPAISNLTAGLSSGGNELPLNLGQLKFLAAPFYDRIRAEGFTNALPEEMPGFYPWTEAASDDNDFAPANIGQLKRVFSFDLEKNVDSDGDGLSDAAEHDLGTNPHAADTDSDGVNDAEEVNRYGTSPLNADTDGDGLTDGEEVQWGAVVAWGGNGSGQCDTPPALFDVVAVSAGEEFTLALRRDGTVVAWGDNSFGQCDVPTALLDAVAVSAGAHHAVATRANGELVAWGDNLYGQCSVPVSVVEALGVAAGANHTVALLSDGTVAAWGDNSHGQCDVPPTLTGAVAVAAGAYHSVALLQDGTVVDWGDCCMCDVPADLADVVAIAAGETCTVALRSDGELVAWGDVFYPASWTIPQDVSGVDMVAAGGFHAMASLAGHGIRVWGENWAGQCDVPPGLPKLHGIAGGGGHTVAVVGLDPTVADSDGDGLPDGYELGGNFNPGDPRDGLSDDDLDGLTWAQELAHGTDPLLPDTDGDGFGDGVEVAWGLNPLVADPDTDADGMPDAWETARSLNPSDAADAAAPSSDLIAQAHGLTNLEVFRFPGVLVAANHSSVNDGIPDWWKARYNLNAHDKTVAGSDADGDGRNALKEYQMGSSPAHDDRVFLMFDTVSNSRPKHGFGTFLPTSPPKRYSTMAESWSAHIGGDPMRDIGPGTKTTARDRSTGADSVAQQTGTQMPNTVERGETIQEEKLETTCQGTYVVNDVEWANGDADGDGVPDWEEPISWTENGSQQYSQTLSDEYTTGDFRSNFAAWFPAFVGNCTNKAFPPFGDLASLNITADQLTLSGQKIRYKFNLDTAASQGNLAWMEVFTPADDPTTPENEANNPVEYYANFWTQGGNETGIFTLDPPATNRFGTYSLIVLKVDLDIYRLEGTKVDEDWDHRSGSITRILNPAAGETAGTGRDKGISLKLEPSVEPTGLSSLSYKLRLKDISNTRNKGLVRVYRRNGTTDTKILDNTPIGGTAETPVTETQFADEFWMEFERGGIIEIELVALNGTTELCKDSVRASGIACRPKSGNIYFVNPSGTAALPRMDFTDACAANLASVVSLVPADANIVVAGATYNESGLTVATKVMIAGLGAAFDNTDPYAFRFDDVPVVDAGNAAGIFLVDTKQDDHFSGLVLQKGKRQNGGAINAKDSSGLSICYTKFAENKADDFGGGVYLKSVTDATINGCVLNINKVDHDDGGSVVYDKGMGGGVASLQSTLTVTNCLFQQNVAQVTKSGGVPTEESAGGGGDIYMNTGTLKVLDTVSKNAQAGFPKVAAVITPSDSKKYFTGDGGSILIHGKKGDTAVEVRDSRFENSTSYGNGGAMSFSKDSSPEARTYFVLGWPSPQWPPATAEPAALGGGCVGLISNVVFSGSQGGWQGGAISANGRGMDIDVMDSVFDACKGGSTHKRDGKGGALAVGGGLQTDAVPANDVLVTRCQINSCSASGNGGGLYVTIRGKLRVEDTILDSCNAMNQGTSLPTDDYRMSEGMGGGIHASAGGYVYLQSGGSASVRIINGSAAVSGAGLSVKSGKAFVQGSLTIQGNNANGTAADGYGNGGGVFITTSYHDDNPPGGAGWGAATLYNDHGYLSSTVSGVTISGNRANRWGGGVYAGISPPWYGSWPPKNLDEAKATLKNATVQNNTALQAANVSPLMPAQVAAERVQGGAAVLDFGGTTISGNATTDIGIYTWDSVAPGTVGTVFGTLAAPTIAEAP